MSDYILAFDVGGTRIKYGILSEEGNLIKSGKTPSRNNAGPESLYKTLADCIEEIKASSSGTLKAIGLGLTGGVDPDKGVVLLPGKFKDLENFPLVPKLKEAFQVPVYADNDGRLAAYAERYYGRAQNKDWAVIITLGTGVGSGVVIDGKILVDPHLLFGVQLGHLIVNKSDDRTCLTGNRGTGEILCSSTALALQVRSAIQRGVPSLLTDEFWENPSRIDFHKVIEACRQEDKLCLDELEVWINNLALVLINAVHAYAPQIIILSGGATLASDLFLDKLKTIVNKQVFRYPANEDVEIIISDMQEYAGVMGAGAMVMDRLK
ncbi:MAG TPA: ROK family protein [Sphingobacterium sp.]|nr:ROK family protein [Sphingobacterium sp.]